MEHNNEIDLMGMRCSAPIRKIANELKTMQSGTVLLTYSHEPTMKNDIPAFCRITGNELLELKEENGRLAFYIKKA